MDRKTDGQSDPHTCTHSKIQIHIHRVCCHLKHIFPSFQPLKLSQGSKIANLLKEKGKGVGGISFENCFLELGPNVFNDFHLTTVKFSNCENLRLLPMSLHFPGKT